MSSDLSRDDLLEILAECEQQSAAGSGSLDLLVTEVRSLVEAALRAAARVQSPGRAALRSQQLERDRVQACILAGSTVPEIKERAECVRRQLETNDTITSLKKKISDAKAAVYERGERMPRKEFAQLNARLLAAQNESQALQFRLGELRRLETAENIKLSGERHQRFYRAARAALDDETFERVEAEMGRHYAADEAEKTGGA